jgi:putative aminopeptidase FrvX
MIPARFGSIPRRLLRAALVLACLVSTAPAQNVFVRHVSPAVLKERLGLASSRNAERKEILMRLFAEAGCPDVVEQPVKGSREGNVICTLAGKTGATILVGAHFDKVSGLGIVDNWSGASMLPSLYQSLAGRARNHTFVFVGFTDEEVGLRGSEGYLDQLDKDQRSRMRAMVNIDCVGMTGTKVWAHRADRRLLEKLATVASSLKLPLEGVNVGEVGDTDSLPFASRKIPVIDIHSITWQNFDRLHEGRDTMDWIKMDDYNDTYKLISVYLGYLDTASE